MVTEDNIIKPCMYNQLDCTTDMSCIVQPDTNIYSLVLKEI